MTTPDRVCYVGYDASGAIKVRLRCPGAGLADNQALYPGLGWLEYDPTAVDPSPATYKVSAGALVPIT